MKHLIPTALLVVLLAAPAARAEVIAEESSGVVPLEGESSVLVRGIAGSVVVWGGGTEGVQFELTRADTKAELPVRISSEQRTLIFEPPAGAPALKRNLFLLMPSGVTIRVEAEGTRVELQRLGSAAEVTGKNLTVELAGSTAATTLELQGGTVQANNVPGDIVLRGREWNAKLGPGLGRVGIYGGPGSAEIQGLGGRLDAELEQVSLRVRDADGEVQVRAKGGRVDLADSRGGGDLRLSESPLSLVKCEGMFQITSNASIKFNNLRSDLVIDGDAATVEGTVTTGGVQVRNHDASLTLSKIGGAVRIEGTTLVVTVKEAGEARMDTQPSTLDLASIGGRVDVVNDGGDVRLSQIFGETSVNSNGGNVRVVEQGGALQLTADGQETLVAWSVLPPGSKSSIENVSGPVVVQLPSGGNGCRIEARTSSGRIESPFKRVVLSGDRSDAQGSVGTDTSTVVSVKAAGDIRLSGGPTDAGNAGDR